jgi:hypothetical protein
MANGRLDKPVFQLPMPLSGFDDVIQPTDEKMTSEAALAALSAWRVKEPQFIDDADGKKMQLGEREVAPRWMDLFKRLVEVGWKWRVAVYIAWAAQPKKYRQPATQEELAIQCLGLTSDRAIATWRKNNESIDETISVLQGAIIFDALPDAMNAMVEVASEADYKGHQDRKLMFEMAGIYTPSSKITAEMAKKLVNSNPDDLESLSDEELRKLEGNINTAITNKHKKEGEEDA